MKPALLIAILLAAGGAAAADEIRTSGERWLEADRNPRQTKYYGEPISLSLRNADLVEVLRSFAEIGGFNMIIQPEVKGTVTVVVDMTTGSLVNAVAGAKTTHTATINDEDALPTVTFAADQAKAENLGTMVVTEHAAEHIGDVAEMRLDSKRAQALVSGFVALMVRMKSVARAVSTFTTSAPNSPKSLEHSAPAWSVRSRTRSPESGIADSALTLARAREDLSTVFGQLGNA